MKIGVTGGTGFVGGALIRRLLAANFTVLVLARPSQKADDLEASGARVVRGDLRDRDAVARLVVGSEVVYHCAAKVDSAGTQADFIEANVSGTETILRACLAQHVRRVVYMSSIAVYGLIKPGESIDENTPYDDQPQRRDHYAQSKILADRFATEFSRNTGLPITVLRPGIVFGAGRPLPVALLGFKAGTVNVIFGDRSHRIPLNYVENLVDALQLVANPAYTGSQQFNIIDDEALTLRGYHRARAEVDGSRSLFFPGWPVLFAASLVDVSRRVLPIGSGALSTYQVKRALQDRPYLTSRIRGEVGWAPKVPLKDALQCSLGPAAIKSP